MQSTSLTFQKILKKIILYGVPVLYFLIAVSFYLVTYDSAQIKITLLHVGGLFLIMSWLVLKIEEGDFSLFSKENIVFILPILLFFLSGLISFSISPFKLASLNEFIKRFIYCFMALIIISEFNDESKLLSIKNWLVFAAYVVCIYGCIQIIDYFFFPPLPAPGLDPFLWRQAFGYRIMSTFGNPNFYGDFLIVMSPIVLALFLRKKSFYLIFLWILIAINTVFTFSKGAWLGYAVGIIVFAIMYLFVFMKDKINKKMLTKGLIAAGIIGAIALFGIFSFSKQRTDSVSFRLFTWLSCWEMINTNPVLGTGIGTFYVTYPAWRRPQIFFIEGKHNTESDHPENEYLEVWFDEGIVGLTIFLLLIAFVFTLGYKNMTFLQSGKGTRDGPLAYLQLGVLAAFAAKLSHDAVCVSLRFVSSGVMLWLLIGVTIAISYQLVKNRKVKLLQISKPVKIVLQIIILIVFCYAINFFYGYFKADITHSQGIQYSKVKAWDIGIMKYNETIKLNPSFPMTVYFKANVYTDRWKNEDKLLAEKSFKELWELAPNYVQSKYLAGIMYSKIADDSRLEIEKFKRDNKSSQEIDALQSKYNKAIENAKKYFEEYIMIDPIFPLTYHTLANLYVSQGNLKSAEETLYAHLEYPNKLKQHPHDFWVEDWELRRVNDYAETYIKLGGLYMMGGHFDPAERSYLNALRLVPAHIIAKKGLAVVYLNKGEKEKEKQQWIEIHALDPNDEDAINFLKKAGLIK